MVQLKNKTTDFIYQIGFSILLFLATIVWMSTLFFVLGVPIQVYVIPVSILASTFLTAWIGKLDIRREGIYILISVTCIIFICAVVSVNVYDFLYDGNTYHKTTIGLLKNGWNPIYQSFEEAALTLKIIPEDYTWPVWYDHYPKASWIIGAAFYKFSENIEMGKCMNALIMLSFAFMLFGRLSDYQLFNKYIRCLFSALVVINPITLPQSQSYYNDGMMQMLIYSALLSLINISFFRGKENCRQDWIAMFAAIHLALNIKYSGLIFMGVYCGGFYFYWLISDFLNEKEKLKNDFIHTTGFYLVTVGSAICFTGSTSYIRNLIYQKNLLYTMVGKDKIEIITTMLPDSYANKPYVLQFICSLFSHAANISAGSELKPSLKLPFAFNVAEIETGSLFDLRIGGWGFLFSGIFLISLCVLILECVHDYKKKQRKDIWKILLFVIALTFIQTIFVPGLAWARYFAHLFIVPTCATGILLYKKNRKEFFLGCMVLILLILNLVNFSYYNFERINISQKSRLELDHLSKLSEVNPVLIHLNGGECMQGYLFNLMDANINYIVDSNMEDGTTIFNWRINYKETL